MELIYSQEIFGRPYMLPPGVPPERVMELRQAFMAALRDPDMVVEAQRIGLDLEPITGEELQALAEKIYATPAAIIEQAKQAVTYKTYKGP